MKKSLIALAVLATTGTAFAQSSVTLYGIVDANVGTIKDTLSTTTTQIATKQNAVNSGGLSTSRWGVKGSEDLGGGLKANFVLEQGFAIDSGNPSVAGVQFDRHALVGVSGGFGEVKLGRSFTVYDGIVGALNNSANHNIRPTGDVWKSTGGDYSSNLGNQIQYLSPSMSGFSAAVGYALGENKTDTLGATDTMSLAVRYSAGPLLVGLGYQVEESATLADTKYTLVGGTYDFGVAKIVGSYQKVSRPAVAVVGTTDENEYQIGASAPLGAATLYFGYASSKGENAAGASTEKSSGYALSATYALSKRTDLYAGYKDVSEENAAGTEIGEKKQFSLGVRHSF